MTGDQALDYARSVCARLGGSWADVAGRSRRAEIVRIRHAAMYAVRQHTDLSYPQIGRLFDRDHTTVIHAVARIEGARRANPRLADSLDAVTPEQNNGSPRNEDYAEKGGLSKRGGPGD